MSIWDDIAKAAGHLMVGVVDAVQDLAMDPISGSMKGELIIVARKSQGKKAPRSNGSSRAALRRRGLVEPYVNALTRRGWNWYKSLEADGDVADFLRANDIDPWEDDFPPESHSAKRAPTDVPVAGSSVTQKARASKARPVSQKSYYRWLYGCLLRMKEFEAEQALLPEEHSVWTILVEEELLALETLNPLLDMDDIRKAKELAEVRDTLAGQALPVLKVLKFDFVGALVGMPGARKTGIRACKSDDYESTAYPVLNESEGTRFREVCAEQLRSSLKRVLPSLR
jgi:hypothetical protein